MRIRLKQAGGVFARRDIGKDIQNVPNQLAIKVRQALASRNPESEKTHLSRDQIEYTLDLVEDDGTRLIYVINESDVEPEMLDLLDELITFED